MKHITNIPNTAEAKDTFANQRFGYFTYYEGKPKATDEHTVEELMIMGIIGIYVEEDNAEE